jgi:hypothetical protein
MDGLRHCGQLLTECLQEKEIALGSSSDLVASTVLCCSTLTRVVGAACLPILRKVMKSLVALLAAANSELSRMATNDMLLVPCRVIQLSILRALTAIIETVPQFITQYLPTLLSGSAILSLNLTQLEKAFRSNAPGMAKGISR